MPHDKTFQNSYFLKIFELMFSLVPRNIQNAGCLVDFIQIKKSKASVFYLRVIFVVEVKTTGDSSQHRLYKIASKLARELHAAVLSS